MPAIHTTDTEQKLVAGLRSGNREFFSKLYKIYAPALLGYITKIIDDQQAAEVVLQKSFIKIWHRRNEYDPTVQRLFIWMLRITKEIALTFVSKKENQNQLSFVNIDDIKNGKHIINDRETINKIGISVLHCNVLDLVHYNNCGIEEAAGRLNLQVSELKVILRSAVKNLKT